MPPIQTDARFIHLHVHSSYSLLEGAMTIPVLCKLALADRQPALALTDTNNLFGALEFSEKLAEAGIQPLVGVQISLDCEDIAPDPRRVLNVTYPSLVLLATSEVGYGNLLALISAAYMLPDLGAHPVVRLSLLAQHAEGVLALTGGMDGPVDCALRDGRHELAATRLGLLQHAYGDRL